MGPWQMVYNTANTFKTGNKCQKSLLNQINVVFKQYKHSLACTHGIIFTQHKQPHIHTHSHIHQEKFFNRSFEKEYSYIYMYSLGNITIYIAMYN